MDKSESELLKLLVTDLHSHYHHLVERYQQRLYAFARRLTKNAHEAEDIVQEAFVSAYVTLENYPPQRVKALKLQAWLYKITFHVFSHKARGARLHLVPLDVDDEGPALEIEDMGNPRPEEVFEQLEQQRELEELIASLADSYRVTITCYYFEHMSYQEIAELLDQPVGTVKSSIFRGIRQLRSKLHTMEGRENQPWNTMRPRDKKA